MKFLWPLRVRYQETDRMGVVYHMNYLNWFEIGRTELIRSLGVSYRELEERGLLLPLTDAQLSFKQPARYDEMIVICTEIAEFNGLRLSFTAQAMRLTDERLFLELCATGGKWISGQEEVSTAQLLVEVTTKHVWLDVEWRPVRLDRLAPEVFRLLGTV